MANGYVLNGTYHARAQARACRNDFSLFPCSSQPGQATPATIAVANPPAAPAHVVAALQPDNQVRITWDPNPEPDVYGYAVFRVQSNPTGVAQIDHCEVGPGVPDPCPKSLSALDSQSGGGSFSYQVFAYRYGATYALSQGVSASATTKPVSVAGPVVTPSARPPAGANAAAVFAPQSGESPLITTAPAPNLALSPATAGMGPVHAVPETQTANGPVLNAPSAREAGPGRSVAGPGLIAVALLLIVLAMHGLWLRRQVQRAGPLEPVAPAEAS
jgi:hypothetical protein